ncbi:MAG: hypothetical protein QJR02_02030 [Sinobacteraceae bacterium]|nr:hypothetical protein [Nevskiaceae bacterium]
MNTLNIVHKAACLLHRYADLIRAGGAVDEQRHDFLSEKAASHAG